jgi:DNA topoisomerase-3
VIDDCIQAWKNRPPLSNYDNLYFSASARALGDWLVGINATRGYSIKTNIKRLSVGRVQTPTLALIVKRDNEVEIWQTSYYFQLQGLWKNIPFLYYKDDECKFVTEGELIIVRNECNGKAASLTEKSTTPKNENPPKPFDLTALQQEANKRFGLEAAKTLESAQALYEAKLITYPRTDSEYLPESMKNETYDLVELYSTSEQRPYLKSRKDNYAFFNSNKVLDHYAIIPTSHLQIPYSINETSRKIYELIKHRFIIAFGKPFQFDQHQLTIKSENHLLKSSFRVVKDFGFKNLLNRVGEEEENLEDPEINLPANLSISESSLLENLEIQKKERSKPKYHTEETLLKAMSNAGKSIEDERLKNAMKEKGLGTAATRASIIETLKKRQYIITNKRNLISTAKGRALIKLVGEHISSPEMTGEWEYKLKLIEKGEFNRKDFLSQINDYIHEMMPLFSEKDEQFKQSIAPPGMKCPCCDLETLRINKGGAFCSNCDLKIWRKIGGKTLYNASLLKLINRGETARLKGFISKKTGRAFEAILFLDKMTKKVSYRF